MNVLQEVSSRNLFPEEIYDLLFKAKLIGEGKVIIKGHYSMSTAPRKGEDGVWRDVKVVDQDSTMDSMTLVPILDVNNRVLGDWTIGLTSEEIKRIHEEARVPKYYADDEKHGDSYIKVSHNQVLDLTDPVHMSMFRIIYPNQAIALNKEDLTEDQDYYFYSPVEEKKKKRKDFNVKQAAVDLIAGLAQEAKFEILELMQNESGLTIPENANEEDKIILFQEQCWDNPKEVLRIFKYKHKEKRIMLYALINHNILVSPNFNLSGPYYRPSVNANQEFGDLIGLRNLLRNGVILDDIINKTGEEMDALIEQINVSPEYELPEKITKKWLSKTIKPGLQAYLEKEGVKFDEDVTNKVLRELAIKNFESK